MTPKSQSQDRLPGKACNVSVDSVPELWNRTTWVQVCPWPPTHQLTGLGLAAQ